MAVTALQDMICRATGSQRGGCGPRRCAADAPRRRAPADAPRRRAQVTWARRRLPVREASTGSAGKQPVARARAGAGNVKAAAPRRSMAIAIAGLCMRRSAVPAQHDNRILGLQSSWQKQKPQNRAGQHDSRDSRGGARAHPARAHHGGRGDAPLAEPRPGSC